MNTRSHPSRFCLAAGLVAVASLLAACDRKAEVAPTSTPAATSAPPMSAPTPPADMPAAASSSPASAPMPDASAPGMAGNGSSMAQPPAMGASEPARQP